VAVRLGVGLMPVRCMVLELPRRLDGGLAWGRAWGRARGRARGAGAGPGVGAGRGRRVAGWVGGDGVDGWWRVM